MALSGSETTQLSPIALPGPPRSFVAKTAVIITITTTFIVAESAASFSAVFEQETFDAAFEEATFRVAEDTTTFYVLARPVNTA